MCGIAGAVALLPHVTPSRDVVARMSRCIAHRGPDGEGTWTSPDGRAILAHRRLAIIDLVTGDQPQLSSSGRIALVFNGEIYNYRELRSELECDGVAFRTQSDTEVLLTLIEREWDGAVDRLRGMFAFAAWDLARGRLLVARDRVGKKPLYWTVRDGVCHFASSLEAVRQAVSGRPALDVESLGDYLSLGWVPAPRTIYAGIHKLEASTVMTLEGDGTSVRTQARTFWDLAAEDPPFDGTFEEAVEALLPILREATRIRLRADVPLGIFLSGGIDSSLVTAMAMQEDATLHTYSVRFDDAASDESAYAARIAEHLGAPHHIIDAPTATVDRLPVLVRQFGEPFADSSALPTAVLAQYARQHVTVALGGDGGDEGFGGYSWYGTFHRVRQLQRLVPAPAARAAARFLAPSTPTGPLARHRGRAARGLRALEAPDDARRYAALRSLLSDHEARSLLAGDLLARHDSARHDPGLMRALFEATGGSALRRMRWVDVRSYLADCLNPKVDVATMGAGLEARAPLLDQDVLRFAFTLPDAYLMDETGGKRLLRAALGRHVPPALFERPKQGFTPPVHRWLREGLRVRLEALPTSEPLRALGVLRESGMRRLVDEHVSHFRDHADRLFALLVLEEWLTTVYAG